MEDSELVKLARRVYAKHKAAFDFIFNHRPDSWSDTRESIVAHLSNDKRFVIDPTTSRSVNVRFLPAEWLQFNEMLSQGKGWKGGGSDQFLLWDIVPDTKREKARIQLILGPGDAAIRDRLTRAFRATGIYKHNPTPSWTTVLAKSWRAFDNEADAEQNARQLVSDISEMMLTDGPKILFAIQSASVG